MKQSTQKPEKPSLAGPMCKNLIILIILLGVGSLMASETTHESEHQARKSNYREIPQALQESSSIIVLTQEDFNKGNQVNIWQLIQGRAPGMWISLDGGAPGAMGSANGWKLNGQPLIVVDGLPQDPHFASGMRDPLNFLNPADIESITLLTDAAASSLYGGRGGNGVILIRTKRAKQGDPLTFKYTTQLSSAQPGPKVDVLDAAAFRVLVSELYSSPDVIDLLGEASTNWQDEIFGSAFSHNHNLSASGNMVTVPWRASFHFNENAGVLHTDHLKRLGGRINLQPSLLDDHLQFNINLHASQLENRIAPRQATGYAIGFDPTQPVRDPQSIFGGYYTWTLDGLPSFTAIPNPVALLNQTEDYSNTQTLGIHANAEYSLHFLPGVTLGVAFYQQSLSTDRESYILDRAAFRYQRGGQYDLFEDTYSNRLLEGHINYNRFLSSINSNLNLSAGITRQKFNHEFSMFSSNIENNLAGSPFLIFSDLNGTNSKHFSSLTFAAGYSYKDLYFANYNFRSDGSSFYSTENAYSGYHSLAAAWKIHNENFWPEDFFLSYLKIKTALGQSGNMDIPYSSFVDQNIRPEKFNSFDLAVDYGLMNNRLAGSIRYFYKDQTDLLVPVPVPSGTNLFNYVLTNQGHIEHKGWEISLGAALVEKESLSWGIRAHLTTIQSHVNALVENNQDFLGFPSGSIGGTVGTAIFILREGFSPRSFWVYQSLYSSNGYPMSDLYIDQNGDGMITELDRIPFQTPYPSFFMGLSSHLRMKNLQFSMAGTLVRGNYAYNNTSAFYGNYSRLYRPEGQYLGNITTEALDLNLKNPHYLSDYFVQDASFFRMDYMQLAYNFRNISGRNLNVEVSATVQNAFVITSYEGPEPEISTGIDFNPYPRPRIFSLGFGVRF